MLVGAEGGATPDEIPDGKAEAGAVVVGVAVDESGESVNNPVGLEGPPPTLLESPEAVEVEDEVVDVDFGSDWGLPVASRDPSEKKTLPALSCAMDSERAVAAIFCCCE